MIILLIIGIVLAGSAVAIAAGALGSRNGGGGGGRIVRRRIEKYSFKRSSAPDEEEKPTGVRDRVDDVAAKIGSAVAERSQHKSIERLRTLLVEAGMYNVTPGRFIGYRIICAAGVPLLWLWFALSAGMKPPVTVLSTLVIGVLAWLAPERFLRVRAQQRLTEIDYQLPELIDLLVVTVEAGLGFVGSLQTAAERITGPLGQELRLTLQEQRMGLSIQEALMNMLNRVDTPSMRSFVRSIVQGETLGVSIGQIMRDLAQEMRRRRRAAAEERAQKAPIKILFPLVFLIFPAMFAVLLGPALILFLRAFGGGG
jgi:tight adherence protein C